MYRRCFTSQTNVAFFAAMICTTTELYDSVQVLDLVDVTASFWFRLNNQFNRLAKVSLKFLYALCP